MDRRPENAAPINHTALSAAGSEVAGVAGGAARGAGRTFWKTLKYTAIICGVVGLGIGFFASGLAPAIGLFAAGEGAKAAVLSPIVSQLLTTLGFGIGGLAVGGIVLGPLAGLVTGPAGGVVGAFKGGRDASERVRAEKGAATVLDAQLQAYQAQAAMAAPPPTTIYTSPAQENTILPAPSARLNPGMNVAPSTVQRDSMAFDGKLAQQQRDLQMA